MLPLIDMMKKIEGLQVEYLVADLGYFDSDDQKESLLTHDVAVVTGFKTNTKIPEHCSPKGTPECEQGHVLMFDGFDKEDYTAWFRAAGEMCRLPVARKMPEAMGLFLSGQSVFPRSRPTR